MPSSAQPAANASSCARLPGPVAQPRGLATNTCTACAPIRRAYSSPEAASPPATGTWPPTGLRGAAEAVMASRVPRPLGRSRRAGATGPVQSAGPQVDRGALELHGAAVRRLVEDLAGEEQ